MPQEIEIKFRLRQPAELRQTLRALGAAFNGVVIEHNQLFDTREQSLYARGCGLRLRESRPLSQPSAPPHPLQLHPPDVPRLPVEQSAARPAPHGRRVVLTYKGPCITAEKPHIVEGPQAATSPHTTAEPHAAAGPKIREEIETEVGGAAELQLILQRLGFVESVSYEKRREAWRLGSCEVALDELPGLGWFVEIEGPDASAVQNCRVALGLTAEQPLSETYAEMAARISYPRPSNPRLE